jgi:hypothetical protein
MTGINMQIKKVEARKAAKKTKTNRGTEVGVGPDWSRSSLCDKDVRRATEEQTGGQPCKCACTYIVHTKCNAAS